MLLRRVQTDCEGVCSIKGCAIILQQSQTSRLPAATLHAHRCAICDVVLQHLSVSGVVTMQLLLRSLLVAETTLVQALLLVELGCPPSKLQ
jgi:hypothetical protein